MAGLLYSALVADISSEYLSHFCFGLRVIWLFNQLDMPTQHELQNVPSLVSFVKITKAQIHPASLKLYSVQVALQDLVDTTWSGLPSPPSSLPFIKHLPKLSVLVPDPVLARAFPALIQQFRGDNVDADEAPDPVHASRMHSFKSC